MNKPITKPLRDARLRYELSKAGPPVPCPIHLIERDEHNPHRINVFFDPAFLPKLRLFTRLARQRLAIDHAKSRRPGKRRLIYRTKS